MDEIAQVAETPIVESAQPVVDTTVPADQVAPAAEAPVVEQPNNIALLSEQFGVDLSGFKDEDSAIAAVRLLTEQFARDGLEQQQQLYQQPAGVTYQQPAPVVPTAPAAPEFNFDDPDLDPKVASVLKFLKEKLDAAEYKAEQANAFNRNIQEQAVQRHKNEVTRRAAVVIDSVASDKYGSTGKRTVAQQMAVDKLYELANVVIYGMSARGAQIPTIEKVMSTVLTLDGNPPKAGAANASPTPSVQSVSTPASPTLAAAVAARLEPRSGGNFPQTGVGTVPGQGSVPIKRADDPMGLRNDPSFQAGVRAIFARHKS